MNILSSTFNNIILDFDSKIDSRPDLEKIVNEAYQKNKNLLILILRSLFLTGRKHLLFKFNFHFQNRWVKA